MNNAHYIIVGNDFMVALPFETEESYEEISFCPTVSLYRQGDGSAKIIVTDHPLSDEEVEKIGDYCGLKGDDRGHLSFLVEGAIAFQKAERARRELAD